MAKIKTKERKMKKASVVAGAPTKSTAVSLPIKKKQPSSSIEDFTWLIYGDKKIGKTSLTSQFPEALIYGFEPGTKALEVFAVDIPNWETALAYNDELFESENQFKNIVIDTGKVAYDRNMQFICNREGIAHPADQAYGKGWSAVAKSFEKFHYDIVSNGYGMVIVSHEKFVETELPSGLKQTKIEPDLSGSSLNFYHGLVDIIARYHFIGSQRFLTIRGNENECAGCRMSKNFLTPSGKKVVRIPMGNSESEAYENLMKAFNNEQEETYANVEKLGGAEPKKVLKKKSLSRKNINL
jgi:hypothetical protein